MAAEIGDGWAPILTGIELKTGTKGVFRILVDGEAVFDKASVRRMPGSGEAAASVATRLGPPLGWRRTRSA